MGQDDINDRWLRQPQRKYGALEIWFAGRQILFITRLDYLIGMLKRRTFHGVK
jgi:hypothetical protein